VSVAAAEIESDAGAGAVSVSTLELFFDLVFVFTITQLTTVLVHEPTWRGLVRVVLMLGVIWWMYGGYAWLTNAVTPDRGQRRFTLLGGMGAFLVLALSIPGAFGDSAAAFGLAYLVIVVIHAGLFTRAGTAIFRIAPWNLLTAGLVLAGGLAGGTAQYVIWSVAFLGAWLSGLTGGSGGFSIAVGHFVERHGLVVIVAIGESVVAIGIGAEGLEVDLGLVAVALLGLALSAGLWWTYFGGDDERAEAAMLAAPASARSRLALVAFGCWHLPLLLGIIAVASGVKVAIGHPDDALETGRALALGGGTALFLFGEAGFRRSLRIGQGGVRLAAAVAALATLPLGTELSATWQLAALVAVLAGALAVER
jgi:low temperature requirement protein LtrA